MSDSPTNTTVWTCPSSSPDPGLLRPTVMSVFQMQHRMTGAAAEDALIHALLLGIGLAGAHLSWRRPQPQSPPQVGRCSATFALQEDECPKWMRLSLHHPVTFQKRVNDLARNEFLKQPSPAQVRLERDRAKMLRDWMPHTAASMMIASRARQCPQNVDFLLKIPERGWFKQAHSQFGDDRLLIVQGNRDYQRLIKNREVPPYLLEIESGGNNWPRVTLHGWLQRDILIRTIRILDAESAGRLGWLVPVGSGRSQMRTDPGQHPVLNDLFHQMVLLRLKRTPCFAPPEGIAARIEAATADLGTLLATQPTHLQRLGMHDDQLVWQLCALLSNLGKGNRELELFEHELHEVVDAATAIAGRIVATHLNMLRQALPSRRSADALARPIVDRLVKGRATRRDLVRTFHKIPTEEVEVSLQRLEHDGLVARIEGGRWAFVQVPWPDLSALLSESVAKS